MKNYQSSQKLLFFAELIVQLTEISQFEKYLARLAKHGKIPIYRLMKTHFTYKSRKWSHNTKLRLMQKYVNAYTGDRV
jgi:hypothetical protein